MVLTVFRTRLIGGWCTHRPPQLFTLIKTGPRLSTTFSRFSFLTAIICHAMIVTNLIRQNVMHNCIRTYGRTAMVAVGMRTYLPRLGKPWAVLFRAGACHVLMV